ncbi:MAG: hypothetical protein HY235_23160 [Acidobacteria bacterium]|nr:hypothetical protein [Acidobacteriota bacterium]
MGVVPSLTAYLLLISSTALGGPAGDLAREIRQASLDPQQCYRVRDLRFTRDDIKLYLTDGFLILGKPVAGTRVFAAFSAEVEGGDAELLLMPPFQRERRSLALFASSPNLNEHFRHAVMVFTDESAAELLAMLESGGARKSEEMGALLAEKWSSVGKSFLGSFEVRLVEDLLSPHRQDSGFFFAAFGGNKLGNFDLIYDPRSSRQICAGQVAYRNERRFFDVWTNFEAQSWRTGRRKFPGQDLRISRVRIDATIEPDLMLKAVTRLEITPARNERVLVLEISRQMHVTEVKVDGAPGEAFHPESLRANLMRSADNQLLLISGPREFAAGKRVEVEVRHEGKVISPAGERVFFVGARGVWYPNRSLQFADYDVVFRFPKELDLVATGDLVDEQMEGEWKISRRRTSSPVRLFGFNLGDYERTSITRSGLKVEVCANRKLEAALMPKPRAVEMPPPAPTFPRTPRRLQEVLLPPPPPPNPVARLQHLAAEIAATFDEMTARFGKPPLKTLTVSPIPGRFGQGFPGLLYLSTLVYLDPSERPLPRGNTPQQVFFSEILYAHEIAHQWWGNGVTSKDYEDDWLMEGLANYSALWALERRKGARTLDTILEDYKSGLLQKQEDGRTVESAGPITMGHRLHSSQSPTSWSAVTYEKGAWILHMLRRRMGDERFQKMLAQLYQRYLFKPVSTAQFRQLAQEFLPPGSVDPKLENFFEQWVYGTGIPTLKLNWTVTGKAPKMKLTGTVTQTDAHEDFGIWVPVEIQAGRLKPVVKWLQTGSEPATFEMPLAAQPVRVTLDPGNATLARK